MKSCYHTFSLGNRDFLTSTFSTRTWKSKGTFKEQENEYLKEFRPKEDFLRILVHAAGMEARCNKETYLFKIHQNTFLNRLTQTRSKPA